MATRNREVSTYELGQAFSGRVLFRLQQAIQLAPPNTGLRFVEQKTSYLPSEAPASAVGTVAAELQQPSPSHQSTKTKHRSSMFSEYAELIEAAETRNKALSMLSFEERVTADALLSRALQATFSDSKRWDVG